MKILYLVHQFFPEYYTGTEKFVYKVSSMMQKLGHKVRVFTYGFYKDSFFDRAIGNILYKEFTYKGIPITAIRHKKIPEAINIALGDGSMSDLAGHLLSDEKPDVLHVGHPMRVNEFITACRQSGIPYLATLTDFWLICPRVNLVNSKGDLCAGPEKGAVCRNMCPEFPLSVIERRTEIAWDILSNAKKVVSPSRFLGGLFRNELPSLDISVIPHGISYKRIKRNNKRYKEGDKLVFCYSGTLNDHKGVHILIEAFKTVRSDDIRLKIFGSGPNPLYVNRLFDIARKDIRIEFCGVYSEGDIGSIFSSVDVVVTPSCVYENYPLALHEALACNTPVIASNIGGMAEKIRDGVNGFSFPVGDRAALAAIMERIAANPEILNALKENMRDTLIPTIEQEAYAYHRIYNDIKRV